MKSKQTKNLIIGGGIAFLLIVTYLDFHNHTMANLNPEGDRILKDLDAAYCDFLLKTERIEKLKETCGDWELSTVE